MAVARLATCSLAQWALDFEGNIARITQSIREAKLKGARYRLGPELEIPGYGCEDHFLESDTILHSWEALATLLKDPTLTQDILCDIGMPVVHRNVRYNCRVFILNQKILLIRPKIFLANDGNYREPRWFSSWKKRFQVEDFYLPRFIRAIVYQDTVPFGEACLALRDTVLAPETCEELFTPDSPHIAMALNGVEIFTNGSGSHHQLRKLHKRIDLIKNATARCGGIYLYSNHQCCDGGRLYFDGCALIASNGNVLAQGSQFSINEVEVLVAAVDLESVRAMRGSIASLTEQATLSNRELPRIPVQFDISEPGYPSTPTRNPIMPTHPIDVFYHTPEQEIGLGPACWLWDYLRRSGQGGFFLPLSGGADSSSTAAIVGIMCNLIMKQVKDGNQQVISDVQRIARYKASELPSSATEICSRIFYTCYMGKSSNSSEETRSRAEKLAKEIGSTHLEIKIDDVVAAFEKMAADVFKKTPKFKVHGGTATENLALQNIQARSRMVSAYLLAQLSLWAKEDCPKSLLVLGSANVDEALRGYLTKYDCSSADINPIGGMSKVDLKKFLVWAGTEYNWPTLIEVVHAPPTAELEPITKEYTQTDEVDMGMSYLELSIFGRLRKTENCGPVSMFQKLLGEWPHLQPSQIAEKVKRFFFYYSINRHKLTTLTPSYHAENYSPDDNRFDLRPFLYNAKWTWQFHRIDALVQQLESKNVEPSNPSHVLPAGSNPQEQRELDISQMAKAVVVADGQTKTETPAASNETPESLQAQLQAAMEQVKALQQKILDLSQ